MTAANLSIGRCAETGDAAFSIGRLVAAIGVLAAAAGLAVLPALAAFGMGARVIEPAAAAFGFVVAIGGGVKVLAAILGAAGFVRAPAVLAPPSD